MIKMVVLKELSTEELYIPGHRLCSGCGPSVAMRMMMKAAGKNTIVTTATGCIEVGTTYYPYTSWLVPWVHSAFENAAATASGIEAAYKAMGRRSSKPRKVNIIAVGGDGGTFDIGIQALSGALERGHDFLYLCYDNEAYMNTGIQRSGATPHGASTTTSWGGKKIPGKPEWKKDLIGISIAHGIDYAATANIAYWNDFMTKVQKALEVEGPAVIHIIAPCPRGWRHEDKDTFKIARLATQSRYFPVYEYDHGKYQINIKVPKPLPVIEYMKPQGRFKHLFKPEHSKELELIQDRVDKNWERLEKLCTMQDL